MLLLIAIIKLPYIILGGIFFTIPLDKIRIQLGTQYNFTIRACIKNQIIFWASIILIACIGLFMLRNNEYVRLLSATIFEMSRTKYLLKTTLETFGEYLLESTIGKFGWLDTPLPMFYICTLASATVVFSVSNIPKEKIGTSVLEEKKFKIWDKMILLLVFMGLSYLITIALVRHTFLMGKYGTDRINLSLDYREVLYQIPYVGGIQGRYYIPAIVPLLISMPSVFEIEQKKYNKVILIMECIYIICTCYYIYLRYW